MPDNIKKTVSKRKAPVKVTPNTSSKTPVKGSASNPVQLKEVVVSGSRSAPPRKPSDSTYVGGKAFADKDIKQIVKNKQLPSIDTTSKASMYKTTVGSSDMKSNLEYYVGKNNPKKK